MFMRKRNIYLIAFLGTLILYGICYHAQLENYNNIVSEYNVMVEPFNKGLSKYREVMAVREFLSDNKGYTIQSKVFLEKKITTDFSDVVENHIAGDTLFQLYNRVTELKNRTNVLSDGVHIIRDLPKAVEDTFLLFRDKYNERTKEYNIITEKYNCFLDKSSVDSLKGFHKKGELINKDLLTSTYIEWHRGKSKNGLDDMKIEYQKILSDIDGIIYEYLAVKQITVPTKEWIVDRLENVNGISNIQIVTAENDLNNLLGKDGCYKACVYFSSTDVRPALNSGNQIGRGTDAGGAIEVYDNSQNALERCKYLSEFDGTLLYSGSYVVVGTMVVRTSCFLSDEQQIKLTDAILREFTKVSYPL